MKKVLIYSNKNAARSQMLEGWLAYYLKGKAEVQSAGTEIEPIHMLAQKAMMESVIDINKFKSASITDCNKEKFDLVIICDETIPEALKLEQEPGEIITRPFRDPSLAIGTDLEKLKSYREVCNVIEDYALEIAMKYFGLLA
ncbi:hypothetical protein [Saccharicrinis aurantiacus]|uniref:arsenate reductase/protein-tyrosine-phosphatase family protein n=1 Tax=Saccharicrinis aurantiacus TaxID=1849719 RepID=UPI00249130BC|nr:hypothetical protein [Saccharicrinis aurantiacus]